jgi:hypothetical protein
VHRVQKSSAAISANKKDYEVGWRCEGKSFDPHSCHVEWLSTLQSRLQNRLFPVKHALLRQKKLDAFSIDCLFIPRVSALQQERLAKQARHLVICKITYYCVSSAFSWSFFYPHQWRRWIILQGLSWIIATISFTQRIWWLHTCGNSSSLSLILTYCQESGSGVYCFNWLGASVTRYFLWQIDWCHSLA